MSLAARNSERTKLKRLLELSQQQIQILEADEMTAFDEILTEKQTLTDSLPDGQAILEADPSLAAIVARIQSADKLAERILYRKVGEIMRELNRVNQQEKARGAYRRENAPAPARPIGFLPDTPMFMDVRS